MKNSLVLLFLVVAFLGLAGSVLAGPFGITLRNPLCLSGGGPNCINDFPTLITRITSYIFRIIRALAVVMFVWAGILFVTSAGNPTQITKAKQALIYAIIGATIALAGTGLIAVIRTVIGATPP